MAVASEQPAVDLREPAGWRRTKNQIATVLMWTAFVCTLIPLGFVLFTVISKGASAISWQFLTNGTIPGNTLPLGVDGMGAAVIGTLEITGFAALMAIPLGVLGAIYINEYGGNRPLARVIAFMADVMTGVPSIVMGLFIYTIWVLHFGYSGLAGAFALGCLMLPVVIRSSYEMLKLVPDSLREGSYALGATKARVTLTVVLPTAISGIVSGALLAIARAAGETAPLLFTILTVEATNTDLFSGPNTALSTQIFVNAQSPYVGAEARAWGAALTLIAIAFILMVVARTVTAIFAPIRALGNSMEQPEQKLIPHVELPELPESAVRDEVPSTPGTTIFDTKSVSIYYGSFRAVTDVSLSIYQNEITAFIGPSGCGKTTVLRTLNRMNDLIPSARVEGDVHYRGASLYAPAVSATAVRRRIGMVFQKPNPFPKSIFDNVAYGPRINGEHNKGRLTEIVERSLRQAALWDEVKDRLNKSGLSLSGGQAQRLCIARTLAVEPDVVLMDEPCSALDPIATGKIEDLMHEIKSRYTIVIVTHNMQQATRVSDRTAFYSVLRDEKSDVRTGVLVEYDRTEKIFHDPRDERTQAYVTGRVG